MRPTDLKDIVSGLLAVIFLAMAFGQYGHLEKFARKVATQALQPKPVPAFFPQGYGIR